MTHDYVLRTPWYDLARDSKKNPFDPSAQAPVVQKYDSTEFIQRLLTDPRDSLKFDRADDVWAYPVFIGNIPKLAKGRARFSSHAFVRTGMRKLYQPSHDRFYALAVELFCDEPGLPSPGDLTGIEVRFVVRRERTVLRPDPKGQDAKAIHELARKVITSYKGTPRLPNDALGDSDLSDVLADPDGRGIFAAEYEALMLSIQARHVVEAWTVGADGRGAWQEVKADNPDDPPELAPGEHELPMWQRQVGEEECAAAQHRSLWFGVVPTFSGDTDAAGHPKLDDRAVYTMRCFARRQPPTGHEHCPARIWWSGPTRRYRLASFHDPTGTKNRHITISAPDFRAVAARAGQPPGPGGVEIVRPPGSQLMFDPNNGSPRNGSVGGTAPESCTYALELFTIVAMFVFSLFLPIVTFLFQLWWLLALRFCTPAPGNAFALLDGYFGAGGTLAGLPAFDSAQPNRADTSKLDDVFGITGAAAALDAAEDTKANQKIFSGSPALVKDYISALDPAKANSPAPTEAEDHPRDPRCPPENV